VRKLVLHCDLSLGDVVLLTAAVRDLHAWYPRQFLTDVRTFFPELWKNSPYITPIRDDDPEAEVIQCSYPLIDFCNQAPYHAIHGFIEFLNRKLHLGIRATVFKGDVHLSSQEKAWYSQVHELTVSPIPFWIVAGGGKHDVTIKWWDSKRYQAVINHFRGRIQFVQIGGFGHHHPKLEGAIDLRGKTNVRELIRLVHHSQGVLCGVTALMHLAAAVETRNGARGERPCVVVAGGREPAHWEAYPGHQFLHTNGTLRCCLRGGCWKNRVAPLRDGDSRDAKRHLCIDVVNHLPRCMDMITADEVVQRIELYFGASGRRFLNPAQRKAAERGVRASRRNNFDQQPLTLSSAGMACDAFAKTISEYPGEFQGRGIVICGGGARYFTNAWVCINMLRDTGCTLPIEFWFLGKAEMDEQMIALLKPLGVRCVDALQVRKHRPVRRLGGWEVKPYAIINSSFREVLLLDADNVPLVNPEFLFESEEFREHGAVFWPDYEFPHDPRGRKIWRSCGLRPPNEREFETGQVLVDKERCWRALALTLWFNENSDFYYQYVHGDKETFHLAFRKVKQPYHLVRTPIAPLERTMCQHDFQGQRVFQHRNCDKWDLFLRNKRIKGFRLERECRKHIQRLQKFWDGRATYATGKFNVARTKMPRFDWRIEAVMISCRARERLRTHTLTNLAKTDWDGIPIHVQTFEADSKEFCEKQTQSVYKALRSILDRDSDYVLVLEDDLEFNRYIRHNLENWRPYVHGELTMASLYNPWVRELAYDLAINARWVESDRSFAGPAFLLSRRAVEHIVRRWHRTEGSHDFRISRLAGQLSKLVLYHAPSLLQRIEPAVKNGSSYGEAMDFDSDWRAIPLEKQNVLAQRVSADGWTSPLDDGDCGRAPSQALID